GASGSGRIDAPFAIARADGTANDPATLLPGARYVVSLRPTTGRGCQRIATLGSYLALGAAVTGFQALGVETSADGGATWHAASATTLGATLVTNGNVCGDGKRQGHEQCDGGDDATCPGRCTASCTCASTTSTATTTTTSSTIAASTTSTTPGPTTTTTLATRGYKAPYADGYLGFYDANTIPLWPQRMILMLGEANAQGPLIAQAKRVAASAGNSDAKFVFYQSLTDM